MQNRENLDLWIEYLHNFGPYVLASASDANYFREQLKKAPAPQQTPPPFIPPLPLSRESKPKFQADGGITPPPPPVVEKPPPFLETAPIPKKETGHFGLIRKVLSKVAPELALLDDIPNDEHAHRIAFRWKTKNQSAPISILIYQEPPEQQEFLENIAKAIDIYFKPAKIVNAEKIEKEKTWETFLSAKDLQWIIVCDYTLWQLHGLIQFYKEVPMQKTRTLLNTPVFLLPDLSLYLKDPLLKRSLWKVLCQKFS